MTKHATRNTHNVLRVPFKANLGYGTTFRVDS